MQALSAFFLCLLTAFSAVAQSEPTAKPTPEIARLIATAQLWVTVNYFHPYLAYRNVAWDKALVDALPKIRAARTSAQYADALNSMLQVLHDPATAIASSANQNSATAPAGAQRTWVHDPFRSGFYTAPNSPQSIRIDLGEDVSAIVRVSEPVKNGASLPLYPTAEPDRAYAEMRFPSVEYRILAAYKIWGTIRYFFAYRDLMDEDWDEVFSNSLPRFIAAKDAREYNLAVSEMIANIGDSYATVESEELSDYFGRAPVGLRLRIVEKKPIIAQIFDPEAKKAGLVVGDIVIKVDDEDIIPRINRLVPLISSSTQQWLGLRIMERILNGPEGSTAKLTILSANGSTKEVELKRRTSYSAALATQRSGEVMGLMSGNIGYVDLDRLTPDQVDAMFDKFANAQSIIFDGRGRLQMPPEAIASRLTDATDVAAAIVTGPLVLTPDVPNNATLTSTASYFSVQRLPVSNDGKPKYKGKTIMLVDETTIGPTEHLGLYLEVANKTEFIGSNSAGADSTIAHFVVPGGITISYSGVDIRHANSGKLQRLGLEPNVRVSPTLEGVRAGEDEVLKTALQYASK